MTVKLKRITTDVEQGLPHVAEAAARCRGLVALFLFGSYARGEATPLSDVDMAYLPQSSLSDKEREDLDSTLFHQIVHTLGTDEVTLVDATALPPSLAFSVLQEGKLLSCTEPHTLQAFAEQVLQRYGDTKHLRTKALSDFATGRGRRAMPIDRMRVASQLQLLRNDLRKLKEKGGVSKEEFLADEDAQIIVERKFQTAIESCVNIGNHLISRLELPLAEEYAQVFHVLQQARILDKGLAEAMADMARFRNLLVHVYWQVDHGLVYDKMKARMATLEKFAQAVERFLRRRKVGGKQKR